MVRHTNICSSALDSSTGRVSFRIGLAPRLGFTLTELLITMAIMAILAGLLLPAVRIVKDAAYSSSCKSNQRQLYVAFSGYAGEFESMLPPLCSYGSPFPIASDPSYNNAVMSFWPNILARYAELVPGKYVYANGTTIDQADMGWGAIKVGVFKCPGKQASDMVRFANSSGYGVPYHNPVAGEVSHKDIGFQFGISLILGKIGRPSQRAMLMDADSWVYCPVSLGAWWRPQGDSVYYNSAKAWHGNRTATNVLFFDGHVEQKKYTDLLGNYDDIFGHY